MSASIYGVKQWCTLTPEKITETVNWLDDRLMDQGEYKANRKKKKKK